VLSEPATSRMVAYSEAIVGTDFQRQVGKLRRNPLIPSNRHCRPRAN
jgi:hypothetical protein